MQYQKGICEKIVQLDPRILIAALIDEKGKALEWHVGKGVPVPDDARSEKMAQQTVMVMSIIKTGTDYLGELQYVHMKMDKMDVIHFPAFKSGVMAVVLNRPYDENAVTTMITNSLR